MQCNVACSDAGTTSISGKVYDPAMAAGLYGVTVYVPAAPLTPLPAGVPVGPDACNCGALYASGAVVSATTAFDGTFTLGNAPVGAQVPLVLQVGKWRREITIVVTACHDNAQPDKSLALPGTLVGAGPNDSMPEIAVSTGSADTLECLFQRIGIPASEYVNGAGGSGHVHIFSGGGTGGGGGGSAVGRPEVPGWGAPASDTALWDSQAHLMPYDLVLLSCEGAETYDAVPENLELYLNAGGRAFASHFHYPWFSGPILSAQAYSAPADWGLNLATWSGDSSSTMLQANGQIIQTLNGSTSMQPFAKGQAFYQWLGANSALGVSGAPATELPILQPRFNAVVGSGNKPSQPWIVNDSTPNTMAFTFDTPVGGPDGGPPTSCGRAVYSDLHVSGTTLDPVGNGGGTVNCTPRALLPQEKAIEFMTFDLSSCVLPDSVPPSSVFP
jgi:hypothetical protein